ncbi:methyltransferase domain-containing protein [bacterium]|nr:methyltransferase domain-containing protein [bacterium]
MLRLVYHVRRSIGTHGLLRAFSIAWFHSCERLGDAWFGIETRQPQPLDLGTLCYDYEATDYRVIKAGLRLISARHRDVVFLDYGCGKGRMLAVAATHSFRRIIGLDVHAGMLAAAKENLSRMRRRARCADIELANSDAMVFEVPDDVNAIFLFNPFSLTVLEVVIRRIKESLERTPREITILYLHLTDEPDPFADLDWCREIAALPVARHLALRCPVHQTSIDRKSG